MSIAVKATLRGVKKLNRDIKAERSRFRKAHDSAMKIVGYRRLKNMAREIRQGAPGGQKYQELSTIARYNSRLKSGISSRKPLTRLTGARGQMNKQRFLLGLPPIRYNPIEGADGLAKEVEVGLTNKGMYPSGPWWIRAANIWSTGGLAMISDNNRRWFARAGGQMLERSPRSKIAKRFFIRKSTRVVKHPKRDIIGPFWRRWREPSIKELNQVFKAKLAGKKVR